MPRRKKMPKIPDFTGIPQDEYKLIVQKSNPLKTLSETGMSLAEFKILDAYLSRIDSHNPEKRFVRFEKGELEKILGVKRILKEDLDARLDGLGRFITLRDVRKDKGFTKIALFEKAMAIQDDDGLWQVDLVCTPSAMEYIFNIEVMGYLPYMLKNIIELTSRYSYVLYIYLESRRKSPMSNTWKIGIDELKQMLRCTSETYSSYKRFNDLILKKCHKEITEKTDLQFSYQPTDKRGRTYTALQFTIETQKPLDDSSVFDDLPGALLLADQNNDGGDYGTEDNIYEQLIDLLTSACDNEFSREKIEELHEVMESLPFNFDDIIQRTDFLRRQYTKLKRQATTNAKKGRPIKNRFTYLRSIIRKADDARF